MIVDTSALLAFFYSDEPHHDEVEKAIRSSKEPLVVSPYVVAELDYLVLSRHGVRAEQTVLRALGTAEWVLAAVDLEEFRRVVSIVERYSDVPIGATDASNMVLAEKHGTRTIATLDRRHFSVVRFSDGTAPQLVP